MGWLTENKVYTTDTVRDRGSLEGFWPYPKSKAFFYLPIILFNYSHYIFLLLFRCMVAHYIISTILIHLQAIVNFYSYTASLQKHIHNLLKSFLFVIKRVFPNWKCPEQVRAELVILIDRLKPREAYVWFFHHKEMPSSGNTSLTKPESSEVNLNKQ